MTYNRTEVMKLAWVMVRQDLWSLRASASALRSLFPAALKRAWAAIKERVARLAARMAMPVLPVNTICMRITLIENRDRLEWSDYRELDGLRSMLAEAQRRETPALAA